MLRNSPEWNLLAIALALAAFGAFVVRPVAAGHKDGHTSGGNKPGNGDTSDCQIDFDVEFADAPTDGVVSDGQGLYQDTIDKVIAFTGSGPGFRLDTNGNGKKEGIRYVCIDLDEDGNYANTECFDVDLRFEKSGVDGNVGLDLCLLASVGDSGTVGINILFTSPINGTTNWLSFVDGCPTQDGVHMSVAASHVTVSRTAVAASDGVDEWTIVGDTACWRDGDYFGPSIGDVNLPFEMVLTAQ